MKNKLRPLRVVARVDSEGMFFYSGIKSNDREKGRYVYSLEFKITQMQYSLELLYKLEEFFGCGRVVKDNERTGGYKYVVTNIKDVMGKIIPSSSLVWTCLDIYLQTCTN